MRNIKLSESTVMQELERIASEKGWMAKQADFKETTVKRIQQMINTFVPSFVKVDGVWGPQTLRGLDQAYLSVQAVPPEHLALSNFSEKVIPTDEHLSEILKYLENLSRVQMEPEAVSSGDIKQNVEPSLGESVIGEKGELIPPGKKPEAAKPEMAQEDQKTKERARLVQEYIKTDNLSVSDAWKKVRHVRPDLFANDGMVAATVTIDELVKLANDLDEMGEVKTATAVDEQLRIYKEAVDKLYDITGETGEQLINEAHPGGGPTMVPAKDEGGKVETIVEEQKKALKVVDKQPTGKHAAFVAQQLVALANRLDDEGKTEAALLVDKTLDELREGSPRPFVVNAGDVGVGEALENFINELKSIALKKPKFQYNIQPLLDALIGYQNRLWNEGRTDENLRLRLIFTLEKDYMENLSKHLNEISWFWRPSDDELRKAFVAERQKNYTLFRQWDQKPPSTAPTPKKVAPKEVTPSAAPAKIETKQKVKQDIYQKVLDNFIGTINTLMRTISAVENQTKIQKLFGGKEGVSKVLQKLEQLKKGTKKPTSEAERYMLRERNTSLYNYLERLRKVVEKTSSIKHILVKSADVEGLPDVGKTVAPKGKTVIPRTGLIRGKKIRNPMLEQFQRAVSTMAGAPGLGPAGADGKWGPKTREAWQWLRETSRGALVQPPADTDPKGPSNTDIKRALNVIQWFASRMSAQNIEIADVRVPVSSLNTVAHFLDALEKNGKIVKESGSLNTANNRRIAAKYLRTFIEQADSPTLAASFGTQGIQKIIQQANALLSELERPLGIPGSYKMPPEQAGQPGPGVGNLGTLEGTPSKKPVPTKETLPAQMSVESQVDNIPDVSGFNNARQFSQWAQRYWMKIDPEEVRTKNPYVIAHKVIVYLEKQIANLQNKLETYPGKNREELKVQLFQRLSALNDVYSFLPKGD